MVLVFSEGLSIASCRSDGCYCLNRGDELSVVTPPFSLVGKERRI
jgi:hypothetical protein